MNDLSWLIYLADVLPNLQSALGFILFWVAITVFGAAIALALSLAIEEEDVFVAAKTALKWTIPAGVFITLLWVAIPSREAIYLIAGSEAGGL